MIKTELDEKTEIDLESGRYLKIWQGPQHPGVTGNMSLELTIDGDEVIDCKTHVGYLHRGFEKLMERRKYIQCFPIVCRICAKWLRTLTLEMARLASFLMWIGGQAASLGMGTVGQWSIAHRDFILDIFEELTGGRVYHMYIIPGGVRSNLSDDLKNKLKEVLKKVEKLIGEIEIVLFNNAIFKMRAKKLGIITKDMIDKYGITGPNQRAAGFKRDIRKLPSPHLVYDKLDFEIITGTESDAYERAWVRKEEMKQSISLIRQILENMPNDNNYHKLLPNILHWKIPAGETYVKAESTRGEYGYYMVSDGSAYPRRVYVRGASYTHAIPVMEKLAVGTNIADIAGLMVSLHTCPPEIER